MSEDGRVGPEEIREWAQLPWYEWASQHNVGRLLAEAQLLRIERDTFAHRLNRLDDRLEKMIEEREGQ